MPSDQSANNIRLGAASNSGGLLRKFLTGKTGYVLAILFATLFTCFAGYRAYSRYAVPTPTFDFSKSGMNDFHNGAYFPSKAFANRINPYASDVCDHYPMSRSVPPYSPVVFILYHPFIWLDLPAADIAFFAFNLLLIGGLTWCTVETIGRLVKPNSRCLLNWFSDNRLAAIWAFGLTATITCLALLVSIYHHSYDALLVLPVWLALLMGGQPLFHWLRNWERWALIGLLTVPVVNYAATLRFRELFQIDNLSITWNVLTSLNGVCLIIALLILMVVSLRKQPALA